mgnify:FL=1
MLLGKPTAYGSAKSLRSFLQQNLLIIFPLKINFPDNLRSTLASFRFFRYNREKNAQEKEEKYHEKRVFPDCLCNAPPTGGRLHL